MHFAAPFVGQAVPVAAVPLLAQVHGAARREPDVATVYRGVRFSSVREVGEYVACLEGGLLERQVQSCSASLHRPLKVFAGTLDAPPTVLALRMGACGYTDFQQPYRLLCIFDGFRPLAVREWNLSNLEEQEVWLREGRVARTLAPCNRVEEVRQALEYPLPGTKQPLGSDAVEAVCNEVDAAQGRFYICILVPPEAVCAEAEDAPARVASLSAEASDRFFPEPTTAPSSFAPPPPTFVTQISAETEDAPMPRGELPMREGLLRKRKFSENENRESASEGGEPSDGVKM